MRVLISKGYGAGWSTWNDPEMAFDKELIAMVENGCSLEEMYNVCVRKGFSSGAGATPYMGGFKNLQIVEIPDGLYFRIREYDGNEYIEYFDMSDWTLAE